MLNISKLEKANERMKETHIWTLNHIVGSVAKVSFVLWGYRTPRNFETVMSKFVSQIRERSDFYSCVNVIMTDKSGDDLTNVVFDELTRIEEFREWNLTELEYQKGVDVDWGDVLRAEWFDQSDKFFFFIDLEAFKQNLWCEFRDSLILQYHFWSSVHEPI